MKRLLLTTNYWKSRMFRQSIRCSYFHRTFMGFGLISNRRFTSNSNANTTVTLYATLYFIFLLSNYNYHKLTLTRNNKSTRNIV